MIIVAAGGLSALVNDVDRLVMALLLGEADPPAPAAPVPYLPV